MASRASTPLALALLALLLFGAGIGTGLWVGSDGGGVDPSSPDGGASPRAVAGSGDATGAGAEGGTVPGTGTGGRSGGGTGAASGQSGGGAAAGSGAGRAGGEPGTVDAGAGKAAGARDPDAGRGPASGPRTRTDVTGEVPASPPGALLPPGIPHGAPPGRAEPPPPYELPERITVRVVDALTGLAVPGTEVRLEWQVADGTFSSSLGARAQEDGTWVVEPREPMRAAAASAFRGQERFGAQYASPEALLKDLVYAVRAAASGYEAAEKGDPGPVVDLGLVPEGRDRFPGRVRVDARWPDGVRYLGRLLVDSWADGRPWQAQWALPEPDGTYLLPGVPPGRWNFRIAGRGDSGMKATVPEGGEVALRLPVRRTGVEEPEEAPRGKPREVEVSVAGWATGSGTFLKARVREGLFWRSEVVGGAAVFAALPAGTWEFVLEIPERPPAAWKAEVPEGVGRLLLPFPAETDLAADGE